MRIARDQPVKRALGVCMGVGFLVLGTLAGAEGRHWPNEVTGERVLEFALALIVAGVAAIVASLTVADPSRIW